MKQTLSRKTIIIAAREIPLLKVLSQCLAELGAEVATARTYRELKTMCRKGHYDLVISRFVAPLISSHSEVLRLRGRGRSTHIFILSHTRDERVVVMLLERGVNQFLSLPISTPRLLRKVRAELTKYYSLC